MLHIPKYIRGWDTKSSHIYPKEFLKSAPEITAELKKKFKLLHKMINSIYQLCPKGPGIKQEQVGTKQRQAGTKQRQAGTK